MGHPVDQEPARAADPFAAVVFEGHGRLAPTEQVLIEGVEHFQKGHVRGHVLYLIGDELPRCVCVVLPPNAECEIHYL
jgi:hypothetical protein